MELELYPLEGYRVNPVSGAFPAHGHDIELTLKMEPAKPSHGFAVPYFLKRCILYVVVGQQVIMVVAACCDLAVPAHT